MATLTPQALATKAYVDTQDTAEASARAAAVTSEASTRAAADTTHDTNIALRETVANVQALAGNPITGLSDQSLTTTTAALVQLWAASAGANLDKRKVLFDVEFYDNSGTPLLIRRGSYSGIVGKAAGAWTAATFAEDAPAAFVNGGTVGGVDYSADLDITSVGLDDTSGNVSASVKLVSAAHQPITARVTNARWLATT